MFRKSYNRAVIGIRIETVTPLLIRAGDAGLDPSSADLVSVRTHHASMATGSVPATIVPARSRQAG